MTRKRKSTSEQRKSTSEERESTSEHARAGLEKSYVLVASFVVGAVILVAEIVGTRVISPYYGASVYVWSSLIGVTLTALAIGYWVGGYAADRWPRVSTLAAEVIRCLHASGR